ncbi:MAG TPA: LpqB family beta-propeller domain-containing protein [Aeromicrobium sp.]|nr:LpqB family beta-propeller domain-containing protein [Aeromicrobium sp.]
MSARRVCGLVVAVLTLCGCAAIPHTGPVTEVVDDSRPGQSTVRYSPALPVDGASPTDIVRGYLDAMLAYPMSTRTAMAFLTPDAAERWRPQAGLTVYELPRFPQGAGSPAERQQSTPPGAVTVTFDEHARLGPAGRYTVGRGDRSLTFHLEQVDGQWRITDPRDGLMVTSKFFDDYYRTFSVYFFDRTGKRLTSVPVHLPVDDRLAAALVASLAQGPADDHLQTFLPPADRLRPTVPLVDGDADVGFTGVDRDDIDIDRLAVQVAWTLRQVPSLSGFRLSVDAQPLTEPDVLSAATTGERYQSSGSLTSAFGLRGDGVVLLDGQLVTPLDGPWGTDVKGARSVAVSKRAVALLNEARSTVTVAELDGSPIVEVPGSRFLTPVVDADGQFWLVDDDDGRPRVRVVDGDEVTTLDAAGLANLPLTAFDIAPDGVRYLVGVGSGQDATIRVGAVVRSDKDVVTALTRPAQPNTAVRGRSPVWSSGMQLSFLTASGRIGSLLVDGAAGETVDRAVLPGIELTRLAVSSSRDGAGYLTTAEDQLWFKESTGTWRFVDSDEAVHSVDFGP